MTEGVESAGLWARRSRLTIACVKGRKEPAGKVNRGSRGENGLLRVWREGGLTG